MTLMSGSGTAESSFSACMVAGSGWEEEALLGPMARVTCASCSSMEGMAGMAAPRLAELFSRFSCGFGEVLEAEALMPSSWRSTELNKDRCPFAPAAVFNCCSAFLPRLGAMAAIYLRMV